MTHEMGNPIVMIPSNIIDNYYMTKTIIIINHPTFFSEFKEFRSNWLKERR